MKKEEFMKQFASQEKQQELILNRMREMVNIKTTNEDEFKKLVERMGDVNYNKGAALNYAVIYNRVGYAKLLIEAGADVNIDMGITAGGNKITALSNLTLGYVKIPIEYFEMVELLLDAGADISEGIQRQIEELYLTKELSDAQ
jgi:ankyrin repeat protein